VVATPGRLLVGVLAAAAVVAVPAAGRPDANLAPNAGFENECAGAPCGWEAFSPATTASDLASPHSESRSARLEVGPGIPWGTLLLRASGCTPIPVATYSVSAWFRTTAAHVTRIEIGPGLYTGAGCGGSTFTPTAVGLDLTPAHRDGQWHQLTGSVPTTGGVSGRMLLWAFCNSLCDPGEGVNFDDVVFDAPPTRVAVSPPTGVRTAAGVRLSWRTGEPGATLGFRVYRESRGARVRVSRSLVAPRAGRTYVYVDRSPPRGTLVYWLQRVGLDGARTWHGPVRVG
jgi:hypothetical protein